MKQLAQVLGSEEEVKKKIYSVSTTWHPDFRRAFLQIIASIHQLSAEVFQFFDNLYLLSAGKTVYFGPSSAAIQFFTSNGFSCPALQNPSDHMLKTINKDFDQENEMPPDDGGNGIIPTEEVIQILVNSYNSSEMNQQVQAEVAMLSETVPLELPFSKGEAMDDPTCLCYLHLFGC
ncbi:ABC transporter G family member [Arachis hypogaea]|nr:ABC transporter G family member [Arachis hypogaea]